MKNNLIASGWVILAIALAVISCNDVKQKPEREKELTILIDSLQAVYSTFSTVNTDQLKAISDTIETHLNDIQRLYVGEQKRELAEPLSKYRAILKLLPDASVRGVKVRDECQITLKQLTDLRDAIASGATVDALGNKINEAYVADAMKKEGDVARLLIKEMKQITDRAVQVHEQYMLYFPVARHVVDSLRSTAPIKK